MGCCIQEDASLSLTGVSKTFWKVRQELELKQRHLSLVLIQKYRT